MNEDAQIKLRLDPDLKEKIADRAKENHRTINSEIVYILENSGSHEIGNIRSHSEEIAYVLASALIEDPKIDIHNIVNGFRQPSIEGIKQAFQLFLYRDPTNRKNLGVEEIDTGLRFFSQNDEYIIENTHQYPDGAYTINHLTRILQRLYVLPMMLPNSNKG